MVDCKECNNYSICEIRKMVEGKLNRCHSFEQKEPQTNADRIRAMSDEELVNVIPCPYMKDDYDECRFGWHEPEMTCEQCKLQWLQSEAKE